MFKVIKTEGRARRGEFQCAHGGVVQTPVFHECRDAGRHQGRRQRLRPAGARLPDRAVATPIICICVRATMWCASWAACTASCAGTARSSRTRGGFQVFSLAGLRKITEEGVTFASPSGRSPDLHGAGGEHAHPVEPRLATSRWPSTSAWRTRHPMTMRKASCERTLRWLERCKAEHDRLNALPDTRQPAADALRHQPGRDVRGSARLAYAADREDRLRRLRHRRSGRGRADGGHVSRSSRRSSRICRRISRAI